MTHTLGVGALWLLAFGILTSPRFGPPPIRVRVKVDPMKKRCKCGICGPWYRRRALWKACFELNQMRLRALAWWEGKVERCNR